MSIAAFGAPARTNTPITGAKSKFGMVSEIAGTFGAVIRIKEAFPSKKALFDIGVAGPIAGFVALVPLLYWGVGMSEVRPRALNVTTLSLGEPLLYAITETGEINTYVHVWVYEDAADRARKRAAMDADPDWAIYRQKSSEAGYLVRQENKILTPAPFFKKG